MPARSPTACAARRRTPITGLLAHRGEIHRYADIRAFTSQAPTRLEVVAADDDPRITDALVEQDFHAAVQLLEVHYNLVCLDTGTGVLESAAKGILQLADQIVVVTAPSLDSARAASSTLDWLERNGHADLVARRGRGGQLGQASQPGRARPGGRALRRPLPRRRPGALGRASGGRRRERARPTARAHPPRLPAARGRGRRRLREPPIDRKESVMLAFHLASRGGERHPRPQRAAGQLGRRPPDQRPFLLHAARLPGRACSSAC